MTDEGSAYRVVFGLTKAIVKARAEADDCFNELLLKHIDNDLDILSRHAFEILRDGSVCCQWCSEDGETPIIVSWPCPEVKGVANIFGVDV